MHAFVIKFYTIPHASMCDQTPRIQFATMLVKDNSHHAALKCFRSYYGHDAIVLAIY